MGKKQQDLFDRSAPAWELDDAEALPLAVVALIDPPHGPLTYRVPDRLVGVVRPGIRVQVPLGRGNRAAVGYCVQVAAACDLAPEQRPREGQLKELLRAIDPQPMLAAELLALAEWIAETYLCPLALVLETMLPPGVRRGAGIRATRVYRIDEACRDRWSVQRLTGRQRAALELLAASPHPLPADQICDLAGLTRATLSGLVRRGLLAVSTERVESRSHALPTAPPTADWTLNDDQAAALREIEQQIESMRHGTFLMYGITGSGKTEVYIRAIQRVLAFGRQAIVLVPEIALTPQTRRRFRERFAQVAVLHSHLSDPERAWHWREIQQGRVQVVIGARSAVFAPLPRLGIIVIDEEHDASFKQDQSPRYHCRDVARRRAELASCPLVLGSATPSLESWHDAMQGRSRRLDLPLRIFQRPLPPVVTLDLRTEFASRRSRGAVSAQLHSAIRQALDDAGQVILLLNRRGYATSIQCPACGYVVGCPDCAIALTHHRDRRLAICHYCEYETPEPQHCPACRFAGIRFAGFGTQKLEQEIRARFPAARVARMDTDSMQRPGSHEQVLDRFRAGEIQILLGTQMIAKGLDFPNVTLVGVINADTALHLPDFRAAERTFALVTQVAGRSGRGPKGGRVLVQTFSPEHPAIQCAARHDYVAFAALELRQRAAHGYPPLARLARVIVRGPQPEPVRAAIRELADRARRAASPESIHVIGPAPAPLEKLRGLYRFHFLLQSTVAGAIPAALRAATAEGRIDPAVQWVVDIDPLDML